MAEGLLKKMLAAKGIDNVEVSSAGTGTLDGYPATSHAVAAAAKKGADIRDHHSTRMSRELAEEADLIFALAANHFEYLKRFPAAHGKVFMLKAFPHEGHADYLHSVKDPIGAEFEEYQRVVEELERELKRTLPSVLEMIEAKST
jgi:protein-tyrosine phosphatase